MPTATTIPVTIQPDAAAFLAEIGQEPELEKMLEHAKATIPHLRALNVVLHDFPETGPPSLTIDAHIDRSSNGHDPVNQNTVFGCWKIRNFPPEVCVNFTLMTMDAS
jgi:hypothetical protein